VNAQRYWYNPILYGPQCPSGAVCRAADVAWFKYDTASWHYGSIARPANANAYPGGSYLAINTSQPVYRLTNGTWYAMQGETVSKVGGTTGLTTGTVTNMCSDLYWQTSPVTQIILCTQIASGNGGDAGDSGAPVFQDTGNGEATLVGILIAGYQPTINPEFNTVTLGYFVYSPWEGIMSEIPPTFGWPQFVR
jgi:V8-like Glu-specific endopeptidase